MAAGVRSIAIRFLGDTKDLQKAGKTGEQAISGWQKSFRKLNRVASGVLVGLGGAIAGAVTSMVRAGDEISRSARNAGVDAEQFQELRFAFDQMGVSADQFGPAVRRLNRRLGLAAEGSGAAVTAFEQLDIAVRGANGQVRDTGGVLDEALPKLAGIESDAERAALASQLFGEDAGPRLAGALEQGIGGIEEAREKAQDLGIVMDQEALDASEDFAASMETLKQTGAGMIRDFALPFLEVLQDQILPAVRDHVVPAVRSFGDFFKDNKGLLLTFVGALAGLAATVKVLSAVIKVVTVVQWAWNVAVGANPIGLIVIGIAALIAIIVLLIANWDTVKQAFINAWDAIVGAFQNAISWIKGTFWDNGLKLIFQAVGNAVERARDRVSNAFETVQDVGGNVLQWFKDLPGNMRSALSSLGNMITSPFRSAFNFISDAWNNTVGQLSWSVPSWVPAIGGNSLSAPTLPKFHSGGVVPGRVGEERLIVAQAGETVRTPEQEAAVVGDTHVTVTIDGRALDESMMRVTSRRDRALKRRVLQGAGAAT